jgi:biopolymer transport protein ExbD
MKASFLSRHKKRRPVLMLTSLLDMFTIILIFLIVSFEAEDFEFQLEDGLALPQSQARSVFKPAVNVAILKTGILVDQQPVLDLANGELGAAHHDAQEIAPLVAALTTMRERIEREEAATGQPADERIIMLQADKALPYRTVYLVMRSARIAGFEKYRLAVMKR